MSVLQAAERTTTQPRFEQFFALRRFHMLGSLNFSPDGEQVSYSHDGSGQYNLWRQPASGGWPTQLTALEEESVRHHLWSPHGFLLGVDHHGNEKWQVNRLPYGGGWPEDLTHHPDVQYQVTPVALADDGERAVVAGNQHRPTDMSLYVMHIPSGEISPLLETEGRFMPGPWHPGGRDVLVAEYKGNTDLDIYFLEVPRGQRRHLTPHEGEQFNFPVGFTADGKGFYLVTDRDWEHDWLGCQPLAGGPVEPISQTEWPVEHARLSRNRRILAWTVNVDGISRFHAMDLVSRRELQFPTMPSGWALHLAVSPDGQRVAAVIGTATRAFDVYVADLERQSVTRLTESYLGGILETDFVIPELVRYPTFDGRQIPAWLYRPRQATGPTAAVLSIHGGPEFQERTNFYPLYQYLLSRGVAVLAPNIRGSTGYGKSYQRLIHRDWGGGELKDIEASAQYLRSLSWVDGKRLAVYGGSFGGFATLSALSRLPDYWAAGVDLVGPSNLVTFARAVPPWWRAMLKRWVGDPDEDVAMLTERSPITYVDQIRAPLMVLQGANDPRVVRAESDQMVERLRQRGHPVEYHVFDDEGHGFTKRRNQIRAWELASQFMLTRLGVGL